MISIVEEMQTEQETLEQELEDYRKYVEPEDESSYETVVSNYETMKYELGNLMAYSALGKNTGLMHWQMELSVKAAWQFKMKLMS